MKAQAPTPYDDPAPAAPRGAPYRRQATMWTGCDSTRKRPPVTCLISPSVT
jgi:hypothetical protein